MSKQIAETILRQLGGNRFIAMTGAKNLVSLGNGLMFKFGSGAKNRINRVRITLNGKDLYDVEFLKDKRTLDPVLSEILGKKKYRTEPMVLSTHNDIYFDMLQELFTRETGFYTSL